jgi:hypothetical protein
VVVISSNRSSDSSSRIWEVAVVGAVRTVALSTMVGRANFRFSIMTCKSRNAGEMYFQRGYECDYILNLMHFNNYCIYEV